MPTPTLTPLGPTQVGPVAPPGYVPPTSQAPCVWNPVANPTWNYQHNPLAWLTCNLVVTEANFQAQPGDAFGDGFVRAMRGLGDAEVSLLKNELEFVYGMVIYQTPGIIPWPLTPGLAKAASEALITQKLETALRNVSAQVARASAARVGAALGQVVAGKALTAAEVAAQTLKEKLATAKTLVASPAPGADLTDPHAREVALGLHAVVTQMAEHLATTQRNRRIGVGVGVAATVAGVAWLVKRSKNKKHK